MLVVGMFKDRLKEAREWAGLSRRALSTLAKLSNAHVSFAEAGKGLSLQTATQLADVLGVSLDWLTARDQAPVPKPAQVIESVARARQRLLAEKSRASAKRRSKGPKPRTQKRAPAPPVEATP